MFLHICLIFIYYNQTLQFIEAYKAAAKLLWDANHILIIVTKLKEMSVGALERIANEFNIDVSAVKIKIKNVRSYFLKERQKFK